MGSRVAVWSLDNQWMLSDAARNGEPYYWTNVWYWLQDDPSTPDPTLLGDIAYWTTALGSSSALRGEYRVRAVGGAYDVVTSDPQYGGWGGGGGTSWLDWCVYLGGYDARGGLVSYKRLRWGLTLADLSGNELSPALLQYIRVGISDRLSRYPLCNLHGELVAVWEADSRLHLWQRRHGSKRVARPVIAIP